MITYQLNPQYQQQPMMLQQPIQAPPVIAQPPPGYNNGGQRLLQEIPAGPGVQRTQYVPVDQPQRWGPTQLIHAIHHDTPIAAAGALVGNAAIQQGQRLFNDPIRCTIPALCSLKEAGRFSDGKQVAFHGLGMQCFFTNTPALYDIVVYFSLITVEYQDSRKSIFFADQLGAGGGVAGFDVNAGAFHLTNGVPQAGSFLSLSFPLIISRERSFALVWNFLQNLAGIADVLTTLNADANAQKLVRVYGHGVEGRDPHHG